MNVYWTNMIFIKTQYYLQLMINLIFPNTNIIITNNNDINFMTTVNIIGISQVDTNN